MMFSLLHFAPRLTTFSPKMYYQFFQTERVHSLTRDVRRTALEALTASGTPGERLLLPLTDDQQCRFPLTTPGRFVRRTRYAAIAQRDR